MFFNSSTPSYYNTFVAPPKPQPQTVSGFQTPGGILQGSGPTNNYQPSQFTQFAGQNPYQGQWGNQQQQSGWGDQGSGKMGYGQAQSPYSQQRNQQNQSQLDAASLQALNQGLTGQSAIDAINRQMGYDTGAVWDNVRGNIDVGTGGPSGRQYDRSGGGGYGAHGYDDAGMPAQSGGMSSSGPSWGGQQTNDPNAWRRQQMMRQHQQPMYNMVGGGYSGGGGNYGSMMNGYPGTLNGTMPQTPVNGNGQPTISDGTVPNGWGGYFPKGTDLTGYGTTWVT